MLLLTSTSDLIRVITGSAVTIDVHADWVDNLSSVITPGRTNTAITTATTTTVVASPASSTQRNVQTLIIRNAHASSANDITVVHTDGTTTVTLVKVTLTAGETLQYNDSKGWNVLDAGGNAQTSMGLAAAGSDTQIQFNDGGSAIGAEADLTWSKTTNELKLGGTDTGILLNNITSEPSSPNSGFVKIYSRNNAGRILPKWKGPSGLDTYFQPAFFGNNVTMWNPTTATAGVWLGTAGAGAGTYTTALSTFTNIYTSMKRARWANVITTANQVLGQRNTEAMYFRGSIAGAGGFFFFARFGFDVWTAGGRLFVGMHTATTVVSAQPSASLNIAGFGIDAGDTAITFMHNDATGTAVKDAIAGQPALASNNGYDAYIFCAPNDSTVYYRLVNINTGAEIINSSTSTDLPVATTGMTAGVLASNAALTPATSIQVGLNRIYVESDY